jgi:multidrug efflux pump subunit AcrA (membrane-fusion protein)
MATLQNHRNFKMNKSSLSILIPTLALVLAACGPNSTPIAIPTVVLNSKPASASSSVTASGEIVPEPKAQLSFPLTGVVESVAVKEGDKISAGQTLVTLDTKILNANVEAAQAGLAASQTQVRYQKRIGTDQEHIDAAQADVDRAQAALTAPFDGTIAAVDISPAETVTPGQIVIMIGDLYNFRVETTDLSERDVTGVNVGQTASVTVQALNQTYTGKVVDVARVSTTVGGDVVYKATIALDSQPQGLRWGMTTDVSIQTGK